MHTKQPDPISCNNKKSAEIKSYLLQMAGKKYCITVKDVSAQIDFVDGSFGRVFADVNVSLVLTSHHDMFFHVFIEKFIDRKSSPQTTVSLS